ncbi:DUF2919 domain-containing protein [Psychromonas sp. psych-6C06]|uniref:DUF2919 domain-containing protein n=1 Tax=Psychromonas sp. psych-6C06 TaxID=2058089 RepID=UPI000C33A8B3|nr:DUF2919 domain-containing protein [Psychromonas sp. psych-6C06]PKF63828.1 DUF2919 domain-containing protein [Psychromonas sp. psych-6C06]
MSKKIYAIRFYTQSGDLKPPTYFYYGLLFLARTWALLIISVASRETGNKLLGIFYPDKSHFYLGLASGLIAIILFLLSGRDHDKHPFICKLWQKGYPFLLLSILFDLGLQVYYLYLDKFQYSLEASVQLVLVLWLLLLCTRSNHLKASFKGTSD